MIKHVAVASLCLCIVSSCSPQKPELKLVATSKEEYEKSLILMAPGLSSKDRLILSKAIAIIQKDTEGLDQVDGDTNKRIKVSGKTRTELINEARTIILDWYKETGADAILFTKYRLLTKHKISVVIEKVTASEYELDYRITGTIINESDVPVKLQTLEYSDFASCYVNEAQFIRSNSRSKFTASVYEKGTVVQVKTGKPRRIILSTQTDDGKGDRGRVFRLTV